MAFLSLVHRRVSRSDFSASCSRRVDEEYQGCGIGKALTEQIEVGDPSSVICLVLEHVLLAVCFFDLNVATFFPSHFFGI